MTVDSNPQDWQSIAKAKRAAVVESIPLQWLVPKDILPNDTQLDVTTFPETSGFFTESELEITSTRLPNLLERIHSRTWTSEEVTKAFCKRAAVAHQLVNGYFLSRRLSLTKADTQPFDSRPTACQIHSSLKLCQQPEDLISTCRRLESL